MHRAAAAVLLVGVMASPVYAQGRGRDKQGIPPGHLPPEGSCRVWYDDVPPGRQPSPTSCYEAERIAAGDRRARVIYGSRAGRPGRVDGYEPYPGDIRRGDDRGRPGTDGRRANPSDRNRTGRAVPRDQYPGSYPYPESRYPQDRDDRYTSDAFRRGYDDGVVKGREDVRDGDSFDPARHSWYRSADRGYNSRFGSREAYRSEYRRGFLAGYESSHDGRQRRRSGWWPF